MIIYKKIGNMSTKVYTKLITTLEKVIKNKL